MDNESKVYYKVLDKDMCSPYRGFWYGLDKTYSTDKPLELCENGFHACKYMYELVLWTGSKPIKEYRFFECTLGDKIIKDTHKVVSNSITLTKEILFEEVDKNIRDNLDILVHDKDPYVREAVADQGYGLDILVHDEDMIVRRAVAKQGYGLDILINDKHLFVRAAVAERGYGLDILINDKRWRVRRAVAEQGYKLDILVHDENWHVRAAVAHRGYGLDILINDKECQVRAAVKCILNIRG